MINAIKQIPKIKIDIIKSPSCATASLSGSDDEVTHTIKAMQSISIKKNTSRAIFPNLFMN